jgi:hypothetical protein
MSYIKNKSHFILFYLRQLLFAFNGIVKTKNTHVLLTSTLLGLDQTSGSINTNNQTTGDLGIKGTTVTSLFNTEDTLNPSNNFVRRRVGRLLYKKCVIDPAFFLYYIPLYI